MGRCSIDSKACDRDIDADMEGTNIPTRAAIRRAIQSAFRGKPVTRVELFGSSARGANDSGQRRGSSCYTITGGYPP